MSSKKQTPRFWTKGEDNRLNAAYKKAKNEKPVFDSIVRADDLLKKRGPDACRMRLHTLLRKKGGEFKLSAHRNRFELVSEATRAALNESLVKDKDINKAIRILENDPVSKKRGWKFIESAIRSWAQRNAIYLRGTDNSPEQTNSVAKYDNRIAELIFQGALTDKQKGPSFILKTLHDEFGKEAEAFTREHLLNRINEVVWTKQADEALRHIVGLNQPLERFTKHHPWIPEQMVAQRAKDMTGVSNVRHPVTFLKGLGRIGEVQNLDEAFELPKSSNRRPIVISGPVSHFSVINGANIGLRHKRVIEENPVRRALADANYHSDDVVFITNPFDIDAKKAAGGLRILRSMASGINTNEQLLDPAYQNRLKETKSSGNPLIKYETVAERFMNMLSGWTKIAIRPDGTPEFAKQVFIVFGYKEEEIISNAAAQELSYWTKVQQAEYEAEIKAAKSALAQALSFGDPKRIALCRQDVADLQALKARHIVSNVGTEDEQRYARKVMHFVVQQLEAAIPNSKVIGQGTTYVKMGDNTVELNIPQHLRVTDTLLHQYNRTHGIRGRMGETAKTTIICHPYALNYRIVAREINIGNERAEAKVFVAPICVDGNFLREALKDTVRSVHPISKVVFSTQFSPGILRVHLHKVNVSAARVPLEALSKKSKPISAKAQGKYIWTMVGTDPHFGSRNREETWHAATKGSLGVSDAVIQMMRDAKLFDGDKGRVHIYTVNDDPTQGNHFETHKQPHPRQMSYQDIEKRMMKLTGEEAKMFALEQLRFRGEDWLQEQIQQVKERHVRPNLDFFNAVLRRVKNSGLAIKGISEIHNVDQDRRDLGAINWGTGNHFESTVDRVMTEGIIYSDYLRALLYGSPEWKDKPELIDKLVVAPLEGNQYFAWGTLKAPSGYEWAVEFRSDPPRLSSWSDPLMAAVNNDALRGDYGLFMTGHKTLKIYGDKHFFSAVDTDHTYYHMCAAGTSTDLYGHRGFPPNNTGSSFVGLPADGPESGPILLRHLHIEHIRKYFKKPYDFDWEEFLPNPV